MIESVNLSGYRFIFAENSINELKSKNFIYGKNGTGKSSFRKALYEEYKDIYDVRIFKGFEDIISENTALNSIALGNSNAKNNEAIKSIDEKIDKLTQKVNPDIESTILSQLLQEKDVLSNQEKHLSAFYTQAANKIKTHNPQVSVHEYWKNRFTREMLDERVTEYGKLSDEQITKFEGIVREVAKPNPTLLTLPKIDFDTLYKEVNLILAKRITPSVIIKELQENIDKQNFAKQGRKLHKHELGEICAFCGNEISLSRWKILDNFFDETSKKFDFEIDAKINEVKILKNRINDIKLIDTSLYYKIFFENAKNINNQINDFRIEILEFLDVTLHTLENKKNEPGQKSASLQTKLPNNFNELQLLIDSLQLKQIEFTKNIKDEKEDAKTKVRFNLIWKLLNEDPFQYNTKHEKLLIQQSKTNLLQQEYDDVIKEIKSYRNQRTELLKQTQDENMAANQINKLLKGSGGITFELKLNENASNGKQKGVYNIIEKNKDGEYIERNISSLSDGEKNIVAFLWFIYSLDEVKSSEKDKVILFDDPMNSNDDGYQYLIIAVLSKYWQDHQKEQLFVLTHNNHFYIQIHPSSPRYDRVGYLHFQKNGKTKVKRITKSTEDLKPVYDTLWEELIFAYNNNKTVFMWNNMRRILETYNRFRFMREIPNDITKNLDDNENKILVLSLIKSLHVNSHVGYEADMDISGKTREQLLDAFRNVFLYLKASDDFEIRWRRNQ